MWSFLLHLTHFNGKLKSKFTLDELFQEFAVYDPCKEPQQAQCFS